MRAKPKRNDYVTLLRVQFLTSLENDAVLHNLCQLPPKQRNDISIIVQNELAMVVMAVLLWIYSKEMSSWNVLSQNKEPCC